MSEKIGVGVVGCGAVSKVHFEAIRQMPELEIVAISSDNLNRTEEAAKKLGCKAFENPLEMIEDPSVQMVVLLTPPGVHHDLIRHALKNKKHLLVEKPIGTNLADIEENIRMAKAEKLVLSVVSQHRFDPASQFVKKKLEQNLLGEPVGANCIVNWYRDQSYYETPWRKKKATSGGGVLAIQAIHTIDLMLWFLGEVESVKAYTQTAGHTDIEVEDLAVACVKFKSGKLATISATTCAYPGYPARLDIFGTDGSVTIEADEVVFYRSRKDPESIVKAAIAESVDDPGKVSVDSMLAQYRDVVQAIKTGSEPLVPGEENRKAYALIDAIYRSARTGNEVKL